MPDHLEHDSPGAPDLESAPPTAAAPPTPQLHSVSVARRRIGVGLTKFYELIAQEEIRTVKIGSRRLVSEDAITDYIGRLEASAHTNRPTGQTPKGGEAA